MIAFNQAAFFDSMHESSSSEFLSSLKKERTEKLSKCGLTPLFNVENVQILKMSDITPVVKMSKVY